MKVYYDSSCIIALYLTEPQSILIRAFVTGQDKPLLLNDLQELEFKNGLRQKVLRGEISDGDVARTLRVFEDDCVAGKVLRKEISWQAIFGKAEQISRRNSSKVVCRSFDLLHVAIASITRATRFATLDVDQQKLAASAGLKVIELQA